ncbi:protein FAM24A-like [Moschus berezovskii]|uniref:protein FAM24A-like n=1 Tax=Moschus berezovskii TaxID=68408 RepID=UPI002444FD93|nr:protein FAM24A-like [Moschus berezovskii]
MFDLEIMIAIGSALLMTAFVLIGVVICLFYKVSNALNAAKTPFATTITCSDQDKVTEAATSTPESYPSFQWCEDCNLPASFDP